MSNFDAMELLKRLDLGTHWQIVEWYSKGGDPTELPLWGWSTTQGDLIEYVRHVVIGTPLHEDTIPSIRMLADLQTRDLFEKVHAEFLESKVK